MSLRFWHPTYIWPIIIGRCFPTLYMWICQQNGCPMISWRSNQFNCEVSYFSSLEMKLRVDVLRLLADDGFGCQFDGMLVVYHEDGCLLFLIAKEWEQERCFLHCSTQILSCRMSEPLAAVFCLPARCLALKSIVKKYTKSSLVKITIAVDIAF